MSKASEWVTSHTARPTFKASDGGRVAWVYEDGDVYLNASYVKVADAIAFARWLIDNYSEP